MMEKKNNTAEGKPLAHYSDEDALNRQKDYQSDSCAEKDDACITRPEQEPEVPPQERTIGIP